ncbi:hypothetical protein BKA63DRAFT_526969 [Paraphoma chrysanthemicola]|nr:hypothetical protein BKA63DRAFT_526969 [Paraphoma chrysanthemicola]
MEEAPPTDHEIAVDILKLHHINRQDRRVHDSSLAKFFSDVKCQDVVELVYASSLKSPAFLPPITHYDESTTAAILKEWFRTTEFIFTAAFHKVDAQKERGIFQEFVRLNGNDNQQPRWPDIKHITIPGFSRGDAGHPYVQLMNKCTQLEHLKIGIELRATVYNQPRDFIEQSGLGSIDFAEMPWGVKLTLIKGPVPTSASRSGRPSVVAIGKWLKDLRQELQDVWGSRISVDIDLDNIWDHAI